MNSLVIIAMLASMVAHISQLVSSTGDPILIVPGIMGSQLNVKHSGTSCNTLGKFIRLWINEVRFVKFICFSPEMILKYDRNTGQYSSSNDDISVKVPGFGGTETVEELGSTCLLPYFNSFVQYFVNRGYERGKSIRAAPYDWRYGPVELQRRGYYKNVKELIETMYCENGNSKVTIVAHSMGAAIMLHFFTQSGVVTQAWKDQYVANFITLSGAWAGGNKDIQAEVSGLDLLNELGLDDTFGLLSDIIQNLFRTSLRPMMRTFQSTVFLLPHPSVFGNTLLVTTPTQSYTANDYEQLFNDIGFTDGYSMYQVIETVNKDFPSPNVPTHCFWGVGVDTPWSFNYKRSFPEGANEDPEVIMADGDGSLTVPSLKVCLRWNNNNGGHSFRSMTFNGAEHTKIVHIEAVLKEIGMSVGASADPVQASVEESWWDKIKYFFRQWLYKNCY